MASAHLTTPFFPVPHRAAGRRQAAPKAAEAKQVKAPTDEPGRRSRNGEAGRRRGGPDADPVGVVRGLPLGGLPAAGHGPVRRPGGTR